MKGNLGISMQLWELL